MFSQKKLITVTLLLSMYCASYSMDNFFNDEQQKNIDPATRALLYTQHQINLLLKELKSQDETYINSNGHFRTVKTMGCITVVDPVYNVDQKAKL